MVFEASLKENIKNGLIYYNKPKLLQALIELATPINNYL
jgi:hypothetical protein